MWKDKYYYEKIQHLNENIKWNEWKSIISWEKKKEIVKLFYSENEREDMS